MLFGGFNMKNPSQYKEDEMRPLQIEILNLLKEKGPMSRQELVRTIGIPRTTIYDNLFNLVLYKILQKYKNKIGARGRPQVYYKIFEETKEPDVLLSPIPEKTPLEQKVIQKIHTNTLMPLDEKEVI
jgi:predicted ArsR family transcriptional regulator